MTVERPSDRDYACFFCGKGKSKDLSASCLECSKPIAVEGLFEKQGVGGYVLEEYVKRGFYGATYYATNRIKKPFALKIIPKILYNQSEKDFDEEIQRYQQLGSHPNIAELIVAGDAQVVTASISIPVYYIVTEWIEGITLTDFTERQDLTVGEMYGAILDISSGVARFEAKNLWHNDLNSDNIMAKPLTNEEIETRRSESKYICKIVDLGSAVFRQSEKRKVPDDVKFVGLHISAMAKALLRRPTSLTKEDSYFLKELGKVVAYILDEDPGRSVNRVETALAEIKSLYARRFLLQQDESMTLTDPFAYLNANDFPTEAYINFLFSDHFPWLKHIVSPEPQSMLITGPRGSGKTMILRSMRLKTKMHKQTATETTAQIRERINADRLAGFFISARIDIGNNCPLTKLPAWAENEEIVNFYFNLLYAYEIIETIHFGMTKRLIDVSPASEREVCDFIYDLLENGYGASFGGLLSSISAIQTSLLRGEFTRPVQTGFVGPIFLRRLSALLKERISFFAKKNIVFLLDDFSLPRIPYEIQRPLLPIIWASGEGYCFRVTAHSDSTRSAGPRDMNVVNREYTEINLGASYINNMDREGKLVEIANCVNDILERRFSFSQNFAGRTLQKLLGDSSGTDEPIARKIRELKRRKKLHTLRYGGWRTVIRLCSGDISYIIDILRRVLTETAAKLPVKVDVQNREIRRYARNELVRLQDYSVNSCHLYDVAADFGKFSLFKLLHDEVGKEKRIAEYLRIEVEVDALSAEAKDALADLLRNGVFIDGGYSSSEKGTPARRLIFKKLFTPVFPTTYNSRDTWPMAAKSFTDFIRNPSGYLKAIMSQHGIPPEDQQLELEELIHRD